MTIYSKIKRRLINYLGVVTTIPAKLSLALNGVKYGRHLRVRGHIKVYNAGTVQIGEHVTINSGLWANPISASTRTCFQILGGVLKIGNYTGISNTCITCRQQIDIGDHVLIGANCMIFDTDFHPLEASRRYGAEKDNGYTRSAKVTICDGAFIGANSIILKGVTIGSNSIIGAGSVIACDVPPNQIWAGNPARYIKDAYM